MRDSDPASTATPRHLTALAALAARTRHPVAITGADHRLRWINSAFTRVVDYEPQEVYGKLPDEFFRIPGSQLMIADLLEKSRSRERGFRIDLVGRTKGGRTIRLDVDSQPFFDREGVYAGNIAIHIDVSRCRRIDDQPPQSDDLGEPTAARLTEILDAIDRRVFLFDANERLLFANRPPMFAEGGIDPDRYLGAPAAALFDSIDELLHGQGLAARGEYAQQRLRLLRSPGAPFEVAYTNGRTLRIQDHRLRDGSTLSVGADVTEAKSRERSLHDAQETAELACLAKSRFLTRMNHELRTPLNAIIGFSELILEREARISRDRVADYAQHVADAGRRLLGIVEEVLEYASIERGDLRLLPQRVATRPLVAAAVRGLRGWARSRKLSITTLAARDCPPMVADPEATTRVLEILIREASKHLDAGGAVNIEVRDGARHIEIEVGGRGNGSLTREGRLSFEPFHAAAAPEIGQDAGIGLSLAVARSLTILQGGTVRTAADGQQPRGYVVTFPRESALPMVVQSDRPPHRLYYPALWLGPRGSAAGSSRGFPGVAPATPAFPDKPWAGMPTGVRYTALFTRIGHGGNLSPASSSSGAIR